MYLRIILASILLSINSAYSQQIEYQLTELPTEMERIATDRFNIYSKTKIADGLFWYTAMEPGWNKSAGLIINEELKVAYRDTLYDGNIYKSFFYVSKDNPTNIIVIAVHGFDDGDSGLYIFEIKGRDIDFLGSLSFLSRKHSEHIGAYEYFQKQNLSIIKHDDLIKLLFSEGDYIHRKDYKEHLIKGPVEAIYDGEKFVLVK